jgi:hypothetical protein
MLKRIEKPKVRARFWEMMKAADNKVLHVEHTRKVKDKEGNPKTITYLMKPHEMERTKIERVFTTCLNWYTDHYNKMHALMPEFYADGSLPVLKTTNPEIGHSAGCSDRTARTMLNNMVDMGVLIKESKGSRGGITIRFSEAFLWGATAEEQAEAQPQNVCPITPNWKNFPHINTDRKNSETGNISGVECVDKDRIDDREGDKEVRPFVPKNSPSEAVEAFKDRNQAGGGGDASVDNSVENSQNLPKKLHTKAERAMDRKARASENQRLRAATVQKENDSWAAWNEKCKQTVVYFWKVAYEKLYAGRTYDEQDVQTICSLIWTDVFHGFQGIRNEKELSTFMARQLLKIEKAAKYFDYHPEKYLPEPHSIVVAGKGYFDKANLKGFVGLEAWVKADEAKTSKTRGDFLNPGAFKERKINRLLTTARKDFEKARAGAPARVEVAHLDFVGLTQYYTIVFQNLGDLALKRFVNQLDGQTRTNFRPQSRSKKVQSPLMVEVDAFMANFSWV